MSLLALRLPMVAAVVVASSMGASILTATNIIPSTAAGEGSTGISGYTISSIAFTLNGTNYSNIDSVAFTATADNGSTATALTTLAAKFDAGAAFYDCTRVGGVAPAHNVVCDTTVGVQLTVLDADVMTIVIVE
ncbi:MAG: hypothetical protein V3S31_04420 [Dehalococcoidia bacterium]